MRPVKVAQTENNQTLVTDGLKPGEDVVVDGQYRLQPGAKVEISQPQGQRPQQAADGKSPHPRGQRPSKS
jgi:membrane fusion protein, multidrug efflux system